MRSSEFKVLGRQIYGGYGWMAKLARATGVSRRTIERMAHGQSRVSTLMAMWLRTHSDIKSCKTS